MAARRNRRPRMTRREKQKEAQPKVKKIPVTAPFLRVPTGIANGGVSEVLATSHSSLRAGKIFDERPACMGHPTPRSSPASARGVSRQIPDRMAMASLTMTLYG
ncbi:hypothetical protein VTN00DRAFT_1329 [Thermoascus crustaceus]|uniref:uncharacterized protein n=1 Tax=Thermoascus crustaceus TaxID=5088 RepID=UPI003742F13B